MNPRVARFAQPIVQVLASFPANFLFPLFTLLLIHTGVSINLGGILLMSLGACTSMTLRLYARRKQWPLSHVAVRLRHALRTPVTSVQGYAEILLEEAEGTPIADDLRRIHVESDLDAAWFRAMTAWPALFTHRAKQRTG